MKTVILAGGFGTRLGEKTSVKPKPMVDIGRQPILWHIMKIYSAQGFNDFIIALGYKGKVIKDHFLDYYYMHSDVSIHLKSGDIKVHDGDLEDWNVHLVDTGLHTKTGGRLKRLSEWIGDETFMMTYGDGVANIDINALVDLHQGHERLATITAVRPPARFGGLEFEGSIVSDFTEKPQIGEGWINGGFFVLEPEVLEYIDGDETSFERAPLERLADEGELVAYRHDAFWKCMDTLRDVRQLNDLWKNGDSPWRIWDE